MEGSERRERLLGILAGAGGPVSGTELAKRLSVSRQVIVQDVALLRAVNQDILATTKGYILYHREAQRAKRCFLVRHTTEQIEEELTAIVENGGRVLDVIITHEIYGEISASLMIGSMQDVRDFTEKVRTRRTVPLKELTAGIHLHTVEADSEEALDRIEEALRQKKILA